MQALAVSLCLLLVSTFSSAEEFAAGRETRVEWDGLAHPIIVSVPKNYDPEVAAPVIFYYHGTNGRPNMGPIPAHTGGRDFVIVAMTYIKQGNLDGSMENLKAEYAQLFSVRDHLGEKLNLDENRTYIAGFSKGGWISSFIAEFGLGKLRGAMIMGAGVTARAGDRRSAESRKRPANSHPIYVGVGQWDGNFQMGLRCINHFSEVGCTVTFDHFPAVSHNLPPRSEYMAQWLALEAAGGDRAKISNLARAWKLRLRPRLSKAAPLERYLLVSHAVRAPYFRHLDPADGKELTDLIDSLKAEPSLADELAIEAKFHKVLSDEVGDSSTAELSEALRRYRDIYTNSPDSHFGKAAFMQWRRCHLLAANSVAHPLPGVSDLPEFKRFAEFVSASKPDGKLAAEADAYFTGIRALLNGE